MLKVNNLTVSAEQIDMIRGIDLSIKKGELHVVMGPNGAGKSTLALALMGYPEYKIKGKIEFNGKEVSKSTPDERARLGMFLAFQHPQEIEGVKVSNLVRKAKGAQNPGQKQTMEKMMKDLTHLEQSTKELGLDELFVQREVNLGFSGGEKKRMEIVQMKEMQPKLIILDEIDSGLDVDGIRLVAGAINKLNDGKRSFLIITHYPRLLKYLKPDHVHVMIKGKIVKTDGPEILKSLEKKGYSQFNKR